MPQKKKGHKVSPVAPQKAPTQARLELPAEEFEASARLPAPRSVHVGIYPDGRPQGSGPDRIGTGLMIYSIRSLTDVDRPDLHRMPVPVPGPAATAGRRVACPKCQTPIRVPGRQSGVDAGPVERAVAGPVG